MLPGVFEIVFVGDFVRNIVHFVDFKVDSDRPPDTVGVGVNSPDGLVIAFVSGDDEVLAVRNQRKQNIQKPFSFLVDSLSQAQHTSHCNDHNHSLHSQ